VTLDPTQIGAWFELGKTYAAMSRFVDAQEAFTHVISHAPHHAGAYGAMGVTLEALGHIDEALAAYRQALAFDPHNRIACERLAIHFWDRNDTSGLVAWCDDLLQRGGYSTQVIAIKLLALGKLGQHAERKALLGLDRFLYADYLTLPADYHSLTAFNRDMLASIKRNPVLRYARARQATRQGWRTDYLTLHGEARILHLVAQIRQAITCYIDALPAEADHPFVQAKPARAQLSIWAILLHADGYETTHLHLDGWLSGVYYVTVPAGVATATDHRGWITFGPPPANRFTHGVDWEQRWIKPEAGQIVLFPSYIYHTTIPTGVHEDRLSVAFDVIPVP
jgi:uncharacterized protein (TIGR02466 family)